MSTLLQRSMLCALLGLSLGLRPTHAAQLLRVTPASRADFIRLEAAAPELQDCGVTTTADAIEFTAAEGRAAELRAQGFSVDVVIDELETFYASRLRGGGDFGEYHTYTEAVSAMDALAASHPTLMTPRQSIGTSIEARTIWAYKVSDNPMIDEDEPEAFFNAYIHAREPISFEVVYALAQHLLDNYGTDARATNIVNGREVWIVPVVNPDGVEYNRLTNPSGGGLWRKNRRLNPDLSYGIDLNRNFGYLWGYDDEGSSSDPSSETYRGTGPFSEPETEAVRQFVNSRSFNAAVYYHSYANLHLFPWGYDSFHPDDYEAIRALGGQCRIGSGYSVASSWEVLYWSNGGANDWMYGETVEKPSIFSFTTEVGDGNDGFWPPENQIPALVAENLDGALRVCELADNPFRALPPSISVISAPDTVGPSFTLSWGEANPDPDNPTASWNLVEATGHTIGTDNLEGLNQNRWTADGWVWSTARFHSSNRSFYGGNANSTNNILTSRRGRLVQPGEQLKFWTWYNIENGLDYGYVEVSTDTRSFAPVAGTITTNNDPNRRNLGNGITGSSGGWTQATFTLSAYAGQVVWLRFRYNTDRFGTNEGWYVDDVQPADLFTSEATVANSLVVPEYSFIGHPTGSYSFLVEALDGESQRAPWSPPAKVLVSETVSVDSDGSAKPWSGLDALGANPFSGLARLHFFIPNDARPGDRILLTIHETSGRRIETVVHDIVEGRSSSRSYGLVSGPTSVREGDLQPGSWVEVAWSATGWPSGIYFARLAVGANTSELKLLHLR